LSLLADVETPDLFEWCILLLEDEANEVRLAALETMKQCDDIDLGLIAPLAESKIQSIRAAAISILALRTAGEASGWYWRGMCDPSTHVRLGTARLLQNLDPNQHRDLFETALYDPEPRIAAIAEELTAGKGFVRLKW
jgi:hypothetical protein